MMKVRAALLLSLVILISGLGPNIASSGNLSEPEPLAPPSPAGGIIVIDYDWNVIDVVQFLNATIYLTGNLTVESTGRLEFVNTTLAMNLSYNGQYNIVVEGKFTMADLDTDSSTQDDASRIISNNTAYKYTITAQSGSDIDFRNSVIMHCGYNGMYAGLNVLTATATFDGMTFQNNYYGITLRNTGAVLRNSIFQSNYYGVFVSFSHPPLSNLTITDSAARGLFLYYSSSTVLDSNLHGNKIGIHFQNSESRVYSTSVTGSNTAGTYFMYASPLLVGCNLSNAMDMDVRLNSFPRLLDTRLNESKVRIELGLYVSVGSYLDVSVVDDNGVPQPGMTVAVLDHEGNAASRGSTDGAGNAFNLAFRERFLTREGPIEMPQHTVMAFALNGDVVKFGENVTALTNGSLCKVTVEEDPPGVEIWQSGNTINSTANYSGARIISLGDIYVNGGTLELEDAELLMFSPNTRTISVTAGNLIMSGTYFSSVGTGRVLEPSRTLITADADSPVYVTDSRIRWITEFTVRNTLSEVRNLTVSHASVAGLKVISSSPRIDVLSVEWSPVGLHLSGDNSKLSEISVERARTYGIFASQSASTFKGVRVNNSSRGVFSNYAMVDMADIEMSDCNYGVYSLYSILELDRISIMGSAVSGVFAFGSSLEMKASGILASGTALHMHSTTFRGESLSLTDNGVGLNAIDCAPFLLNSSLNNTLDIRVERGSSASLVNSTLDPGKISILPSGHIDIGDWFHVRVLNDTLQPVPGCNVSVTDSDGRVSDSGVTDSAGMLHNIAFRQKRLLWNASLDYHDHSIMAFRDFNGSLQGAVGTPVMPEDTVDVQVSSGGMGWIEWTIAKTITVDTNYSDATIIAHAGVAVEAGGLLGLDNTTLWFFGNPATNTILDVKKDGSFDMRGSSLQSLRAKAPLQPSGARVTYRAGSGGELSDSLLMSINQVSAYTSDLTVDGSRFREFTGTGLYVQASSPSVNNTLFYRCADGMRVQSGSPSVSGTSFVESKNNGFYAGGGRPTLDRITSLNNYNGFYLVNKVGGNFTGCLAEDNEYGFYLADSSPGIADAGALNNTHSGFYLQSSHPDMVSVTASGNMYGVYLHKSWPVIYNSTLTDNYNGIHAYQSAPYISDSDITGNNMGFNALGNAAGIVANTFSSGKTEEHATFVDGGTRDHISVTLPSRAIVREANITVRGSEMGAGAVAENGYTQFSPEIHGNWLVWQERRDEIWDIHAYDLSMDSNGNGVPNYLETPPLADDPALVRITDAPYMQSDPDIYNGTIVWTDYRNGNPDIYAYTFSNDTEWAVCTHPASQLKPAIHGDRIVWQDYRNGNYDIYMLNISTGEESRLSDSPDHDMGVNIHENYVVWYSYRGSASTNDYSDIMLFDISKWELLNINDDVPVQYSPDVHGDTVVWHDNRNDNWEIYMYDIVSTDISRLTYDPDNQQNFMPRIYGDKVVYYFRNRITDLWSVRMSNISTGTMTVLERDVKGDSHPVVYGQRVAWVNRTDNLNDIYVLDFALSGYPSDVRLDINKDGSQEFFHPGELDGDEYVNGTWLADVFNMNLDRMDGGTAEIPMSITVNRTGRVILGPMTVKYDMPMYVVNTSIDDSGTYGVRCSDSSPIFVNSSFSGNPLDLSMTSGSRPVVLNTSFSDSRLHFQDKISNLTVRNFLHVRVQNLTGEPLDAGVRIEDNGRPVHEASTGEGGNLMWTAVTDRTHNLTGRHENSTRVAVSMNDNIFADNPRYVNMSVSHWEVFQIADTTSPTIIHNPVPSASMEQIINIAANITDNVGIASVTLYYQNVGDLDYTSLDMLLSSGNPQSGDWTATIPAQNETGILHYFIWANDTSGNNATSPSMGSHSVLITGPPGIVIVNPKGGEIFTGGSIQQIEFTATDTEDEPAGLTVFLNYTSSAGNVFIAQVTGAGSPYNWLSPKINATDVKIVATVIDSDGNKAYAESPMFTIDSTLPRIVSTSPANNTTGISIHQPIVIQFSEPMNITSVVVNQTGDTDPGGWQWFWNETSNTLTGIHNTWARGEAVEITVHAGYMDASEPGNANDTAFVFTFTTETNPPPEIVHANISGPQELGDAIRINATITDDGTVMNAVLWWRDVDGVWRESQMQKNGNDWEFILPGQMTEGGVRYQINATDDLGQKNSTAIYEFDIVDSTPPVIIHAPVVNAVIGEPINITCLVTDLGGVGAVYLHHRNDTAVNFTQTEMNLGFWYELTGVAEYYIRAVDVYGNEASTEIYTLEIIDPTVPDTTPPGLLFATPTGAGIPITTTISIVFTGAMDRASVENAISVSPTITGITYTWLNDQTLIVSFDALQYNTTYAVTIGTGAADLAGNALASAYSWQFTTAMEPEVVEQPAPNNWGWIWIIIVLIAIIMFMAYYMFNRERKEFVPEEEPAEEIQE